MMRRDERREAWMIERQALNELSPDQREELARRADLESKLEALRREDDDFVRAFPASTWVPRIREQIASRRRRPSPRPLVLVAAAACTLALISTRWVTSQPSERAKGLHPALSVYRKSPAGPEQLPDGALAQQGDWLQLAYVSGGRTYGAIVSVDGLGTVTPHFPGQPLRAQPLSSRGEVRLPSGYRLDAAPGFERFFLVTASKPFELEPILEAARRAAASGSTHLQLPSSFEQVTVTLRKAP